MNFIFWFVPWAMPWSNWSLTGHPKKGCKKGTWSVFKIYFSNNDDGKAEMKIAFTKAYYEASSMALDGFALDGDDYVKTVGFEAGDSPTRSANDGQGRFFIYLGICVTNFTHGLFMKTYFKLKTEDQFKL